MDGAEAEEVLAPPVSGEQDQDRAVLSDIYDEWRAGNPRWVARVASQLVTSSWANMTRMSLGPRT